MLGASEDQDAEVAADDNGVHGHISLSSMRMPPVLRCRCVVKAQGRWLQQRHDRVPRSKQHVPKANHACERRWKPKTIQAAPDTAFVIGWTCLLHRNTATHRARPLTRNLPNRRPCPLNTAQHGRTMAMALRCTPHRTAPHSTRSDHIATRELITAPSILSITLLFFHDIVKVHKGGTVCVRH